MYAKYSHFSRTAGLLAGTLLTLSSLRAAAAGSDAFPAFDNYVKVSGLGVWVNGDKPAYQTRTWNATSGAAGIEDLRYTKDLSKDSNLLIEGHALFGNDDYLGHIRLGKEEAGSIDIGYSSFRTFYDGVGGFFPLNNKWMPLTNRNLHLDRSKLWVEAKIARPNTPEFTVRYTDEVRDGMKDSTLWGDTDLTWLPTGQTISQVRKIYPGYRQLDEHHRELEASVKHTIRGTTVELILMSEKVDNLDTFYGIRFPGEIRTPVGANPNNQVALYSREGIVAKTFDVTARTETVFSKVLTLRTAWSYEQLDADLSGNRPLFTSTPTSSGAVVVTTYNFLNLAGKSNEKTYKGSIALDWKPKKDLLVQVALLGEDKYLKSPGSLSTVALASGSTTVTAAPVLNQMYSRNKETVATPTVKFRYKSTKNVVIYASVSQRLLNGDERYATPYSTATPSNNNLTYNDVTEDHTNFTLGVNWQPTTYFSARAETFVKDHQNKFIGYDIDVGTKYVLGYRFQGVKLTGVIKPLPTLSFTTRYVGRTGNMQVTAGTYGAYNSGHLKNDTLSESIDWTPSRQFYLQGNASLVFNSLKTIYPRAGIAANGLNANGILQNADNNYWTMSAIAGWVVDKDTDAQAEITFYSADNYKPALAAYTLPYGAEAKERTITVGLKHKFSDRLVGSLKLGHLFSHNDTTGGLTNYNARVAYVMLDYKLF
jgi:hypothetical protein